MNGDTDIEDIDAQIEVEPAYVDAEPKSKKRFGPFALIGTAFLASLLGAGAIYGVTTYLTPTAPDMGPMEASIKTVSATSETLAAETKTLKAQIARLERDLKARPAVGASPQVDLTPIERRLAALEDAAASEATSQIDGDVLARLEALQSEGSEALDLSEIFSRLDALEAAGADGTDDLGILERLEALELRPQTIVTTPTAVAVVTGPTLMPPFPEDKIRGAIERTSPPKSWLDRTLKKHISVQSEDNPAYLLETVLKNLEAGEVQAALTAFDKLPTEVKSAGQDWRDIMESSE